MNPCVTTKNVLIQKKNPSTPAAAPAATPSPSTASVRPAALEVVVACAVDVLDDNPPDEGAVPMEAGVPLVMGVSMPVGVRLRDEKREESEASYELVLIE
jgi:hypothetical protein